MNYKSYSSLAEDIRLGMHRVTSRKFDLVVGIPRSGMVPAYMIGLYLNVKVTDLRSYIDNAELSSGVTRKAANEIRHPHEALNVLLVDDSVGSGVSMRAAISSIPSELHPRVTSLAVYADGSAGKLVDISLAKVPGPRVFEWNILHRSILQKSALDIDGVLCLDPTSEQNDDGEKYIDFIRNATPFILPTHRVSALVTSRLEKYRQDTVGWLAEHGVEYDHLVMLDLPTKEERQRTGAHGEHKAKYYANNASLEMFVESEPAQAELILHATGKPVYCTGNNVMYSPGEGSMMLKSPSLFLKRRARRIYRLLPNWLKKIAKVLASPLWRAR